VPDVVRRRADHTAEEVGRADPRLIYKGVIGLEAESLPGIHSVWYRTEWEWSGKGSG